MSSVILSIALLEARRISPPGVSYTPLDFMPTNLFSTISILPIPFSPPILFNLARSLAGDSFSPLIEIKSPLKNSKSIIVGVLGASSQEIVLVYIDSFGCAQGSSKIFPSYDVCRRFASIE